MSNLRQEHHGESPFHAQSSHKLPILVINLDRRVNRWESIYAFFEKKCQSNKFIQMPIRISAVDDAENPGRGCTASHQRCLEYAKREGADY